MRYIIIILLFNLIVIPALTVSGQTLPPNVCTIKNGELEFTIDLSWNEAQKMELQEEYNLDSLMIEEIFGGRKLFTIDGEEWQVFPMDDNRVVLKKPVQKKNFIESLLFDIFGAVEKPGKMAGYVYGPIHFGYNKFERESVIIDNNVVTFKLFGFPDAQNVILSGSFNNWNTQNIRMENYNGTWSVSLDLVPGKYYYKFIVDGIWTHDLSNKLTEPDGTGGRNSVLFVTNHTFELSGFSDASEVVVAGSFNNWQHHDAHMINYNGYWQLPVYLDNGMHYYKFIVDGNWITDPDNPVVAENEYETGNSVITIGEGVEFYLNGFQEAEKVFIAGSFNNWNPGSDKMIKDDSGWYNIQYLNPGNYEYKFIVDGKWITDPDNPVTNGTGEFENSFFAHEPNYTFVLDGHAEAEDVFVSGTFNNWIHHGYRMQRNGDHWELSLFLPKGKTKYKFIVDGEWIPDPENPEYEQNRYNTFDSVIWIE
jgi:hypothetical protein